MFRKSFDKCNASIHFPILSLDEVLNFGALRQVGLVISVSASHVVGHGFMPQTDHTKDHHKNGSNFHPAWHACIRVGV